MGFPVASSFVSRAPVLRTASPGALVVAGALPLLFLHRTWQPAAGSVALSDLAVLAVVVAAVWSGIRDGFAPLLAGRWIWAAWGFLAVWLALATLYGAARFGAYPFRTHLVTLLKWYEYALLAPALPLLVRTRRDLELVLWSLALWSAAATIDSALISKCRRRYSRLSLRPKPSVPSVSSRPGSQGES